MPSRLAAPVLTVDAGRMHQIDTRNVENLHSMWTVFNRCADAMEEGRRLENLSWRIWNRETFCCDHRNHDAADMDTQRIRTTQQQLLSRELPQLSSSVDSVASDDIESRMARSRLNISPPLAIKRLDSSRSSLSGLAGSARDRHISSFALERMVISIKERKNPKEALPAHVVDAIPAATASAPAAVLIHPLDAPAAAAGSAVSEHARCAPIATFAQSRRQHESRSSRSSDSTAPLSSASSRGSRRMDSDTSADSMLLPPNPHNAVRGFNSGQPSSYKASPRSSAAPIPARAMANEPKFEIGASRSSNEDESSLITRISPGSLVPSKSSLTSQLKREPGPPQPKKTTSFREIVESHTIADEDPFESSDEEDEDAIEDDGDSDAIDEDDGEWEDSASESEDEDAKPPMFKRIDSTANLSSRRSLLTTGLNEGERAAAMQEQAAKLQSSKSHPQLQHHGRTRSPRRAAPAGTLSQLHAAEQRTQPKAIPMSPSLSSTALALSPKTTRRNMLAHELTESLRMHLLHERAMKSQVNNASRRGIERRHTAQGNLSQLRSYPMVGHMQGSSLGHEDEEEDEVWENGVFGSAGEYHERGW